MRLARMLTIMNMQSWSDHVLNLVNSTANVIAIIAAALVVISVALIYFTGTELTGRARQKNRPPIQVQTKSSRLSHTEAELAATQRSDEANALRLSQVGADLAAARRSEETKALRLSEIDAELAAARRSEEIKALL